MPLPVQVAADPDAVDGVRRLVYDTAVRDHGGTFSAEHGIGPKTAGMYRRYVSEDVRELSAVLKRRFDPDGILGWSLSSPDRVSRRNGVRPVGRATWGAPHFQGVAAVLCPGMAPLGWLFLHFARVRLRTYAPVAPDSRAMTRSG
ncbi:FAD-linked oxidase C-terminal domain-containing protein [Saccharopolyspora elongata]|uniref:FAD-linked oxidase C-terminal domain-containing protein n=1 Tax=Saccharopolyspora elongata TaxID=2530387 RepID=UPI0022A6DC0E|nr:FAD-linked oxidase C-terminal domain-containing protein [Saccharopolyspora elongata]